MARMCTARRHPASVVPLRASRNVRRQTATPEMRIGRPTAVVADGGLVSSVCPASLALAVHTAYQLEPSAAACVRPNDQYHKWATHQLPRLIMPSTTCDVVLAESWYMLRPEPHLQEKLLRLFTARQIIISLIYQPRLIMSWH
jgi:hypothetical protein